MELFKTMFEYDVCECMHEGIPIEQYIEWIRNLTPDEVADLVKSAKDKYAC